jgi:hypothetical protein
VSKLLCQNCKGEMRWNPNAPAYRCSDPGCRCETAQGCYEHVGEDCTLFLWLLQVPDDAEAGAPKVAAGES